MHRSLVYIAITLLIAVYVCGPALEGVDPWDIFPDSGDDVILVLTAVAIWFGAALTFALLIPVFLNRAEITALVHAPSRIVPLDSTLAIDRLPSQSPLLLRI